MKTRKHRRKFSSAFKVQVALVAIKEEETLTTLSRRFDLHANQILKWKKEFLANMGAAFEKKNAFEQLERENDRLYKKVGELEMERDWLKKTADKLGVPFCIPDGPGPNLERGSTPYPYIPTTITFPF